MRIKPKTAEKQTNTKKKELLKIYDISVYGKVRSGFYCDMGFYAIKFSAFKYQTKELCETRNEREKKLKTKFIGKNRRKTLENQTMVLLVISFPARSVPYCHEYECVFCVIIFTFYFASDAYLHGSVEIAFIASSIFFSRFCYSFSMQLMFV